MKIELTLSKDANPNYVATICKVGELKKIPDSDHLCTTVVNGYDIVVSNDMKEGTTVLYFTVETRINDFFLSANNLFSDPSRNRNYNELLPLIAKKEIIDIPEEKEKLYKEIKGQCGFFEKQGRVKIIKLRGVYSEGFICPVENLNNLYPEFKDYDWEEHIGQTFDQITIGKNSLLFCWKYVPLAANLQKAKSNNSKANKRLKSFDRIIPGTFEFHYSTSMLNNNIDKFTPDNIVDITVKVHGCSLILSNLPIKRKLSIFEKVKKFIGFKVEETEYGNIYSSRTVIKNRYINKDADKHSFYDTDIWGCVNRVFAPYISPGLTVYGEIVGYLENSSKMVQKNHDYGCNVGEWKFMPYRITKLDENNNHEEWTVTDVDKWTRDLVNNHPELENKVLNLKILYHGRFGNLYPSIVEDEHWGENILSAMKNDTENLGMEQKEELCHLYEKEANAAKVSLNIAKETKAPKATIKKLKADFEKWESLRPPREGVVVRISDDKFARAFKLKTNAHYDLERKQHDNEEEVDIEEVA